MPDRKRAARPPRTHTAQIAIGELARRAGVAPSTVRYYESVKLLPAPDRANGHRRYDPSVVRLLQTARFAQEAGFTVAEIRTLFHGFGADVRPSARWRALAQRKLVELDALIARAAHMRHLLNVGMQCGCLRVEDCDVAADVGCGVPSSWAST